MNLDGQRNSNNSWNSNKLELLLLDPRHCPCLWCLCLSCNGDLQQHTLGYVLGVRTASGSPAPRCRDTVLIPLGMFRKLAGMPMAECGLSMRCDQRHGKAGQSSVLTRHILNFNVCSSQQGEDHIHILGTGVYSYSYQLLRSVKVIPGSVDLTGRRCGFQISGKMF